MAFGKAQSLTMRLASSKASRFPIRDTAECHSALWGQCQDAPADLSPLHVEQLKNGTKKPFVPHQSSLGLFQSVTQLLSLQRR